MATISDEAKAEALAAVAFAENGAVPTVSDISTDIYWESDHATESSETGRHFFDE